MRYELVAQTDAFRRGIDVLLGEAAARRTAILCAEENPSACHRRLLITPALRGRGAAVAHIRGDGRLEPEEDLLAAESANTAQLSLFTR